MPEDELKFTDGPKEEAEPERCLHVEGFSAHVDVAQREHLGVPVWLAVVNLVCGKCGRLFQFGDGRKATIRLENHGTQLQINVSPSDYVQTGGTAQGATIERRPEIIKSSLIILPGGPGVSRRH